jgi:hypothetical protein
MRHRRETKVKGRGHRKEARPSVARGPHQVGVILGIDVKQLPIGGHHIHREDVFAGEPPFARVPAEPALKEEPADSDCLVVTVGEHEAVCGERREDVTSKRARLHKRHPRGGVDLDLVEVGKVQQHAAVAQEGCRP